MRKLIAVGVAALLAVSLAGCGGNTARCAAQGEAKNSASAVIYMPPPRPIIPVRPVIPPRPVAPAPRPVAPKPVTPAKPPISTNKGTQHDTPTYHAPIFIWPWWLFGGSHNNDKCN
jgi:hypothetical protein